jgi:hypothetical protein
MSTKSHVGESLQLLSLQLYTHWKYLKVGKQNVPYSHYLARQKDDLLSEVIELYT